MLNASLIRSQEALEESWFMLDKASTTSSIRQLTRIIIKLVVVTVLLLMC